MPPGQQKQRGWSQAKIDFVQAILVFQKKKSKELFEFKSLLPSVICTWQEFWLDGQILLGKCCNICKLSTFHRSLEVKVKPHTVTFAITFLS